MNETTETSMTDVQPEPADIQKTQTPRLIHSSALSDEQNAALKGATSTLKRQGMGGGH